jgi:AmiR/NasT family two-component response regulator
MSAVEPEVIDAQHDALDPLDPPDLLVDEVAQLRQALATRDVIGQAKGILMERFKVSAEDAFQILRVASQHKHCKVRELAESLVVTGKLPVAKRP